MKQETKDNLKNRTSWIRILYMAIFAVFWSIAFIVVRIIIIFQIILFLLQRETNERARLFSAKLNRYVYDILQYLTFNSDNHVFPFVDWYSDDAVSGKN